MKNKKRNLVLSIIGVFIFTIMVGGISYAYFVYNKDVATANLTSGNININFGNKNNVVSFANLQPMNDATGIISPNYLEFTVTGTADIEAIKYELEIVPKSGNTIDSRYIKFYLTEYNSTNGTETVLASPFLFTELYDSLINSGKGIYQDLIKGNNDGTSKNYEKKYRLRSWIDESYKSASSGTFAYGVYLYAINTDTINSHILAFDMGDNRTLSKVVTIGEDYGSLPTPSKEGYNLDGWYKASYNEPRYKRIFTDANSYNVIRLSPSDSNVYYGGDLFDIGDIIDFEVETHITITSLDINDKIINSNNYNLSNDNKRVSGRFVYDNTMVGSRSTYDFIDINCLSLPTSYTINKFNLVKFNNEDKVTSETVNSSEKDFILYAKWMANN